MTSPLGSLLGAWRLPLRIARRDALRHRGRSVLTLVMIALPVLAVTTADVLIQTVDVSGVESIDRRMGGAQALVRVQPGVATVEHGPDPDVGFPQFTGTGDEPMPGAERVASALGGARLLELRSGETQVRTDKGAVTAAVTEVELTDPLTEGLFELSSGRLPQDSGEVVVNQALVDKGYGVGETLDRPGAGQVDPIVVGIAESTSHKNFPSAAGPIGSLGLETEFGRSWLVDGTPVSWDEVRELNAIGVTVASRAVITDPPPTSEWPASADTSGLDEATVAVLVLIVVMALIEVVLLAGPAFAVGARRQQRSLALISASGGTPVQARRVIVGSAVVLGSAAAVCGVLLGIALARVLVPAVQSRSGDYLGPFDVPWLHLVGVAGFGLLSAFLAAVVPAYLASRMDVVAVLAGRRGDRAPSMKSPIVGLVLLGGGITGSVVGATGGGEIVIAASAIPTVLGMILLIPLVLAGLGRVSGRLPLILRYAARDAARHRSRTVPAVAAVAATVAGVVALGVGVTSDEAQNKETYTPTLPMGVGLVSNYADPDWEAFRRAVAAEAPDASVSDVTGLSEGGAEDEPSYYVQFLSPDGDPDLPLLSGYSSSLGSSVLVSDASLDAKLVGLGADQEAESQAALDAGRAVVLTDQPVAAADVDLTVSVNRYDPVDGTDTQTEVTVPARLLRVEVDAAHAQAVLPTKLARTLGVDIGTVGLLVRGAELSEGQQEAISEVISGISPESSFYVERGYQADDETLIAQLVLIGLGGILMLGGTLTATFLALSDARPDLATLSAVGASPRTRRGVAAAYAVVVGFVGALLGAAVGFIPGIAVTYPLTSIPGDYCVIEGSGSCTATGASVGPFLDVPWLMILGLVVALPLLTAAVVGIFARSRLPLVARLD